MRTLLTSRLVSILMFCVIFVAQLPTDASAQWHSRSKELPGLVSTKSLILIGVGTAGAIFLLAKLSKSGKDSKAKAQKLQSFETGAQNSATPTLYAQVNHHRIASEPRVAPFVVVNDHGIKGIDSFHRNMNLKNKTVSLGLFVGF